MTFAAKGTLLAAFSCIAVGLGSPAQAMQAGPAATASATVATPSAQAATPSSPDIDQALTNLGRRLRSLTPAQQEALRAVLWQDIKNKTVAQVYQELTVWRQTPSTYVSYMTKAIDQAVSLSPEAARALAAQVPEDFGKSAQDEGGSTM